MHVHIKSIMQHDCTIHGILVPYRVVWKGSKFEVVWEVSLSSVYVFL